MSSINLSLTYLFMYLGFVFLTKRIFGIKVKNMKIYMFLVYWTYVHMKHASKCLSIMFLYLDEFLDKAYFQFKNPSLEKYGFWFSAKFVSHKNGSKSLKFVLKFFTQVCILMSYDKTIFVNF